VVVDRPHELERERLRLEVVEKGELLVELEELLVGPREEEVGEVAGVGEPERLDLAFSLGSSRRIRRTQACWSGWCRGATSTCRLSTASTTGE
jgi:hypothetical protein